MSIIGVSGDTMILTINGYIPINEIVGDVVNVWNGHEFSTTTITQSGIDQSLLEVTFDNGASIKCTPYQKFHIQGEEIEARNLTTNMKMDDYNFPIISEIGDSCHLSIGAVPINCSIEKKFEWISKCTTFVINSGNQNLNIRAIDLSFLKNVQLMIQTLGCDSKIYSMCVTKGLPIYDLVIDSYNISKLVILGLNHDKLSGVTLKTIPKKFIYVTATKSIPGIHTVYTLTEPLRNSCVLNAILTFQ